MHVQCTHDSLIHFLLRLLPLGGISLLKKNCKVVYEAISVMQKTVYVKVDTFTTCFPTVMHIFMKVFELDLQGTKEN